MDNPTLNFYDFLELEDGRLGLVVGDATGKGMPAALVMATTRGMLRAVAQASDSPGEVLARVNDALYPDIPSAMFVTCFYAIPDPASGRLRYANAGHDLPYVLHNGEGAHEPHRPQQDLRCRLDACRLAELLEDRLHELARRDRLGTG